MCNRLLFSESGSGSISLCTCKLECRMPLLLSEIFFTVKVVLRLKFPDRTPSCTLSPYAELLPETLCSPVILSTPLPPLSEPPLPP